MATKQNILTGKNLKELLWQTVTDVKDGQIELDRAYAISSASREIVRTTKVQLQICLQSKTPVTAEILSFNEK